MIYIENKRKSEKKLLEKYPNAIIADVTSKSNSSLVKLSPFYPHGDIPIPFSKNEFAQSVEGIWQGLKVFEHANIDRDSFDNKNMKNIKRTVRKFGEPLGHRKGTDGQELFNYIEARFEIYLPTYLWVLQNKVTSIIERLKEASERQDILLLDYETNCNVINPKKPLSHAFLIKAFIDGEYPSKSTFNTDDSNIGDLTKDSNSNRKSKLKKTDPKKNERIKNQKSLF
jgi:hypothetical protein